MTHPLQSIVADAMDRFDELYIVVVGTDPRVTLPARFEGLDAVVLRFEPRNPRNVQNLAVEPYGITALMSFGGAPFTIRIPWGAVATISTPAYNVQAKTAMPPPKPALRVVR